MLSLDVTGTLMSREVARVLRVKKSEFTTDMYNIIDWDYETKAEVLWNSKIDKFIEEGILGGWMVTWDTSKDLLDVPIVDFWFD